MIEFFFKKQNLPKQQNLPKTRTKLFLFVAFSEQGFGPGACAVHLPLALVLKCFPATFSLLHTEFSWLREAIEPTHGRSHTVTAQ